MPRKPLYHLLRELREKRNSVSLTHISVPGGADAQRIPHVDVSGREQNKDVLNYVNGDHVRMIQNGGCSFIIEHLREVAVLKGYGGCGKSPIPDSEQMT